MKTSWLAAVLALGLVAGCSQPGVLAPAASPAGPEALRPASSKGSAVGAFVIASGNVCPPANGKPQTVPIDILAETPAAAIISGPFASSFTLTNSDRSGNTHLSRTTIGNSSEEHLTLKYSGKPMTWIRITAKYQITTAYTMIYPGGSCINASPDIVVVHNTGSGSPVTLTGVGALPPYVLSTSSTSSTQGCGSFASTQQTGTSTFVVSSRIEWDWACLVFATANSGNVASGLGVLLTK
ncbi:MAG: hypothetical protein JO199_14660 [Candidatus Eremiobacteraeota bacterium]|nr:hypothetical protein [Candidatus Eremiobacteraeota bacterium]